MPSKRNFTVALEAETIHQAKILAARRGSSVSRMLSELICELVERDRAYEVSKVSALAHMERGYPLGGDGLSNRSDLHER